MYLIRNISNCSTVFYNSCTGIFPDLSLVYFFLDLYVRTYILLYGIVIMFLTRMAFILYCMDQVPVLCIKNNLRTTLDTESSSNLDENGKLSQQSFGLSAIFCWSDTPIRCYCNFKQASNPRELHHFSYLYFACAGILIHSSRTWRYFIPAWT